MHAYRTALGKAEFEEKKMMPISIIIALTQVADLFHSVHCNCLQRLSAGDSKSVNFFSYFFWHVRMLPGLNQ